MTWAVSGEREARDRRLSWTVELFVGDRIVLAAAGAGHRDARAAEAFAREVRAALPRAEVRTMPTLKERMEADLRLAEERRRQEEELEARLKAMREEAYRLSEEEDWTDEDWDRFYDRLDAVRHEGDDDEEDWEDGDDENDEDASSVDQSLVWEVREEGGRPQAVLFCGRRVVLSTAGLLRIEAAHALIDWTRTGEVVRAPIERR